MYLRLANIPRGPDVAIVTAWVKSSRRLVPVTINTVDTVNNNKDLFSGQVCSESHSRRADGRSREQLAYLFVRGSTVRQWQVNKRPVISNIGGEGPLGCRSQSVHRL